VEKLNSRERNILRKEAHTLKPVVVIGKKGMSREVTAAVDAALADHELIKIRFLDFKDDRKNLSISLAETVKAKVISVIGNITILYRELEKD
jgi:RNA-binding protein